MYAEDCILFNSGNNWNRMFECIQTDLDNVNLWCHRNRLKLSETKSKVLLIGLILKTKISGLFNTTSPGTYPFRF